eukprot:1820816-Amphidinium_carterae.1
MSPGCVEANVAESAQVEDGDLPWPPVGSLRCCLGSSQSEPLAPPATINLEVVFVLLVFVSCEGRHSCPEHGGECSSVGVS